MPSFTFSGLFNGRGLAALALLLAATSLPVAWILNRDVSEALDNTRLERSSIRALAALQGEMKAAAIRPLSTGHVGARESAGLAGRAGAWAAKAKDLGQASKLILDPDPKLFHWAYLSTIKLPERAAALIELAGLESRGNPAQGRAAYLLAGLADGLGEERRALGLALNDRESPASKDLLSQDLHRAELIQAYGPGRRLELREAVLADFRFWEMCIQAMEGELLRRELSLTSSARLRLALVVALLALALAGASYLALRASWASHGEALKKAERSYKTLYQAIPQAAFVYDLATRRFLNANPAACELLGLTEEQLIGMSLVSFIPPERREAFIADLKSRDPKDDAHDQQRLQIPGGRMVDVEVFARYIELDGQALRLVMLKDVTEAKAAREALVQSEARHRALLEDSSEVMVLMSPEGRVLYCSPSALAITGYTPEERVGSHSSGVLHPEDQEHVWKVFKQAVQDPSRTYTFEARFRHKDGHYIHTAAKLRNFLADPNVGALALNYRDISPEKEAARQAMRLERLAAVGQTAAGLAHEVRNPLAAISMRAQFLRLQLDAHPALHAEIDSILAQSGRIKDLVRELLERARGDELEWGKAGARELLSASLESAKARFGQGAEAFSIALDAPQELELEGDIAQLERVLVNLILNAFQALPPGGALTLRAAEGQGCVEIEVLDNGAGIAVEKLGRIFEPFFTTKQTGSGLGLWICRSIAEQHGGVLEARNLKPRGAAFLLKIPRRPA